MMTTRQVAIRELRTYTNTPCLSPVYIYVSMQLHIYRDLSLPIYIYCLCIGYTYVCVSVFVCVSVMSVYVCDIESCKFKWSFTSKKKQLIEFQENLISRKWERTREYRAVQLIELKLRL